MILTRAILVCMVLTLTACASTPKHGEMRQYSCEDGTAFALEVSEGWVRLHTVTGVIELPHQRGDARLYTNGLRSIIVDPDESIRHAVGRRAWTQCSVVEVMNHG